MEDTTADSNGKPPLLEEAVVENAKWVNTVLVAGNTIAATIVLMKLLSDEDSFSFAGVELPLDYAWLVMVFFSAAHFYTTVLLVGSCHTLWKTSSHPTYSTALHKIQSTGGLFMRGMIPRTERIKERPDSYVIEMKFYDPTTWLAFGSAALILLALLDYSPTLLSDYIVHSAVALAIIALNWKIGAHWVIALSELSLPKQKSKYHAAKERDRDVSMGATSARSGVVFPSSTKLVSGCGVVTFLIVYIGLWMPISITLWLVFGGFWVEILRASIIFVLLLIVDISLDLTITFGEMRRLSAMDMMVGNFLLLPASVAILYVVFRLLLD
jgi:hypothetical protein